MSIVDITSKYLASTIKAWDFGARPLIVGILGPQGSGKSYLADHLKAALQHQFASLRVASVSIDDFYLPHAEQKALSLKYPRCGLVTEGRGLPGTHSLDTAQDIVGKMEARKTNYAIPAYDKSRFAGEGDRAPPAEWTVVGDAPLDIVIFEGWFMGFKAVSEEEERRGELERRWERAVAEAETETFRALLERVEYEQVEVINRLLRGYEALWARFDRFVYIATDSLVNVYQWRLQQEKALILRKGAGMTEEQVRAFVDRYYPVYKLYYLELKERGLLGEKDANLRIDIDLARTVTKTTIF